MLNKVWSFFKNPVNLKDQGTHQEKRSAFFQLALLTITFSIGSGIMMELIANLVGFNFDNHAVMDMLETLSPILIFFAAVILAPVIEELLFRGPLALFKSNTSFKYAFYGSVLLFGLIHITNFGDLGNYYWLAPILIAPQLSAGIFLGYIRTKFGLLWSILLHAVHNLVLLGPFIIMKLLDVPFE